jgi:hypothetical protein
VQTTFYILSQLVDSEMLSSLSPEELREMLAELDDEVVNSDEGQDGKTSTTSTAADAAE